MTTATPSRDWDGVPVAAASYERDLVPALFEPWALELVELAGVQSGERVLDMACGTGVVTRIAAAAVGETGHVTGVDVNDDMLATARLASQDVRPAIEWHRASAVDSGLPDEAYDVAFCQQALQFVPDRAAAVRELYRVLVPGGRVAVSTWCDVDSPAYAPFAAAFERHIPETPSAAGFVRAIFALNDADELRDLLEAAGFRAVTVKTPERIVRFPSPQVWVDAFTGAAPIPALATLDEAVRTAIANDVVDALQPLVDDEGFAFPIRAHVAVARR